MTSWMKGLLIASASAAGVVAVAAGVYFAMLYFQAKAPAARSTVVTSSTSPDFTKTAYQVDSSGNLVLDSNGDPVPFTGPVHPGDQVEYVLTYKPPTTGATGPVTITDTLSSNQSYVDPSIQAPTGWTYPNSPAYLGNTETYSNPGFGPGVGFTLTVPPVGPSFGAAGNSTGDGFQPIPVPASGHVYGLWHHKPDLRSEPGLMCWNLSDLSPCAGYSKPLSSQPPYMVTPNWPHAVVVGSRFYFPEGREQANNTTADIGIGCWDTTTESACPFIMLPGNPTFPRIWTSTYVHANMVGALMSVYAAGLVTDPAQPTHLIVNANNQLFCIDATSSLPCAAWTSSPPLAGVISTNEFRDMIAEDGTGATRVFVEYNGTTASPRIACRLLATGANCPGWTLIAGSSEVVLPPKLTQYLILSPVPSSLGWNAVCAHQFIGGAPACVSTATGSPYGMPAIFTLANGPITGTATIWSTGSNPPSNPNARYIVSALRLPGTRQVLYPYFTSRAQAYCFDFATNNACTGFSSAWSPDSTPNSTLNDTRDYGYAPDPADPENCFFGLGDHEIIWRFRLDGAMGRGVCTPQHIQATFNIDDQFCAHKPKQATWTNVEIVGRPTELVGGTIVIKDGSGTVVQTIAVTSANSYPVNLAASGGTATLSVEFTPNYGTNTPPTTSYQIKLDYTADVDPQICYRATVKDCTETLAQGPVTNTAIYTDTNGSNQATVNLGNVTGGHCGPPPCLTNLQSVVALNPNGTATLTLTGSGPPGFTPTILNLHSNTPGVTVTPPSVTLPPGPINTSLVLTGVTPGQSVDIQIDAVEPGAGTNGSDKCCSTTITVTIPHEGEHHDQVDVGIQKTGFSEAQGPADGSGYTYTLSVTNLMDSINGQNAIVVTDVVPAGLSFASAGGTDWNCVGPFPIGAGGTLTCTYTGSGTLTTGQILPPITIVSTNAVPGTQLPVITNCANVAFTLGSGFADTNAANNHSCTTNGDPTVTGSLTVIKVIEAPGLDTSAFAFQAQVSCIPSGGSAAVSTLTLNQANSFTQSVPNLIPGTVCSISEQPVPGSPSLPANCRWVTQYPQGQQVTTGSGNTTSRIVNKAKCTTLPPVCDPRGGQATGKACPCVEPGMKRNRAGVCACPPDTKLVHGKGCTIVKPPCDLRSTSPSGNACVCLYPSMSRLSKTACGCRDGARFLPGEGCTESRTTCPQGSTFERGHGCVQQASTPTTSTHATTTVTPPQPTAISCKPPMIANAAQTGCQCPDGMKMKGGKCVKKGSFLDNFSIGIGVGSGSHKGKPADVPHP